MKSIQRFHNESNRWQVVDAGVNWHAFLADLSIWRGCGPVSQDLCGVDSDIYSSRLGTNTNLLPLALNIS